MTPTEQRNQRLGEKMIQHLERRHFEAYYCETGEEAAQKVNELIPDGSSVTWGGTMTVRDLQIPQLLKGRGTLDVWDRDLVETPEKKQEMYYRAFHADYYLSSANAISEDGIIVNIDGNGNRVAARFDIKTPCQIDGQCHNCNSPQSICNYVHFLRNSSKPGRIIVILVGECLGY